MILSGQKIKLLIVSNLSNKSCTACKDQKTGRGGEKQVTK